MEKLQTEHKAYKDSLEDIKKRYHFPLSRYVVGWSGMYIAMEDLWLEYASGQFLIDLIPNKDTPQFNITLCGTNESTDSGMSIRVRLDEFKTKGDKGSKVPKVSLDKVKVTATVRISIQMSFNVHVSQWICPPKNFRIDLLSFRGPFGTRRTVVSAYLAVMTPMLRGLLLDILPRELGQLSRTLPSPICIRGKFEIRGTNIKVLSRAMHKDPYLCDVVGYNPQQMYTFQNIQKSFDR